LEVTIPNLDGSPLIIHEPDCKVTYYRDKNGEDRISIIRVSRIWPRKG